MAPSTGVRRMASSSGLLLLLAFRAFVARGEATGADDDCVQEEKGGYSSPNGCRLKQIRSVPLRVVYLDKQYVTQNDKAIAKMKSLDKEFIYSKTCESRDSIAECFVAENWQHGWMGRFMWGVFTNYMGLEPSDIVAMTTANFSEATNPKNDTSVYKGSSSFTRCVWEVRLGHVDVCVGDFWETQERRSISTFTTAIAVDKFKLVTLARPETSDSMFVVPQKVRPVSLYSIFQPFKWEVWVLHVAMMVFGAAAILFMEATGKHVRTLLIDSDPDADDGEGGKPMRLSANGFIKSVFASLTHFLWNGPKHDPQSVAGKAALFALSFHTLIIAASYTASLAGFLATSSPVPVVVLSFESIKTSPLASLTGKLCVLQSAQGLFNMLGPGRVIGMDGYGPMFEYLHREKCGSAVTGENEYLTFVQASQTSFSVCANETDPRGFASCQEGYGPSKVINLFECPCANDPATNRTVCSKTCPNLNRYKDVVPSDQSGFEAWYNWALPVRNDLNEIISYAIVKSRLNNDLGIARQEELEDKVTAKFNLMGSPEITSSQINIEGFLGVYVYTGGLVVIAIVMHCFQCGTARMSSKPKATAEGNEVDQASTADLVTDDTVKSVASERWEDPAVYVSRVSQRLKQLNEEIERKLACPSTTHIHAAPAPDPPKQQTALASKAGSIAPSMEGSSADWALQSGPAAPSKQLGTAAPAVDSGAWPAGPIRQQVGADPGHPASDPAVGRGMIGPSVGEPVQTMRHPAADLLARTQGHESYEQTNQLPATAPAPQQGTFYVPESSVDTDGSSLPYDNVVPTRASAAGLQQRGITPSPVAKGERDDDSLQNVLGSIFCFAVDKNPGSVRS